VDQVELLRKISTTCDKLAIPYVVVGSMASSIYGEPRFTNDIDVVLDLQAPQIEAFCLEFPDGEYYLSRPAVKSAVRKRFQFNIIHTLSGLKIDCIVASRDPFDENQLTRGQRWPAGAAGDVRFAAPEDVIIKKMDYFRLGESEKHMRDIAGMLKQQGDVIDRQYIRQWAVRKGLVEIWDAILARLAAG